MDDMTEVEFVVNLMVHKQKNSSMMASNAKQSKILLCGSWEEISPCLDYIMATKCDKIDLSSIIIATSDLDEFISHYFGQTNMRIANWDENEYEQVLIEHVRSKTEEFTIELAIEFQPTLRRLKRIRKLLELNGTLVIPYENTTCRAINPELMNSFTANQGNLIKLTENLYESSYTRLLTQLLGHEKRISSRPYFKYKKPSESSARYR